MNKKDETMLAVASAARLSHRGSLDLLRHSALTRGADFFLDVSDDLPHQNEKDGESCAWKPKLIRDALHQLDYNDYLVWIDPDVFVRHDMRDFVAPLSDASINAILLPDAKGRTMRQHISPRCLDVMSANPTDASMACTMRESGVQCYKKCDAVLDFLDTYVRHCEAIDAQCPTPDLINFQPPHDQSALSVSWTQHRTTLRCPDAPPPIVSDAKSPFFRHGAVIEALTNKVAVVTGVAPRGDDALLTRCVESVARQTAPGTVHFLVADGPDAVKRAEYARDCMINRTPLPIEVVRLPRNTGGNGYNAHLIYAAMSFLIPSDEFPWICFADEDNAFVSRHVEWMLACAKSHGAGWVHSLRSIVLDSGVVACEDACESLGLLADSCLGDRLIDTSCMMLLTRLARKLAPLWDVKAREEGAVEADRAVTRALIALDASGEVPGACTRRHSVLYRTGTRADSVSADFFRAGNAALMYDFAGTRQDVYVFHFDSAATHALFASERARLSGGLHRSLALDEYQPNMLAGLRDLGINLIDGYAQLRSCAGHIPRGATVLCIMCHPESLPLPMLKKRTDLRRVCYLVEGPNWRHTMQYTRAFLRDHFTHLLTYYSPLLTAPPKGLTSRYAPYPHRLDVTSHLDLALMTHNKDTTLRSIGMVLERRAPTGSEAGLGLKNAMAYLIDGTVLHKLDALREQYVAGLRAPVVYGRGWHDWVESNADGAKHVTVGSPPGGKAEDSRHAVDHLAHHTFALIIENTDASHYTSEKVWDALMAESIPIYLGTKNFHEDAFMPPDMYIDARLYETPEALQAHIDSLSDEEIRAFRARISARRTDLLAQVGVRAIAKRIVSAL